MKLEFTLAASLHFVPRSRRVSDRRSVILRSTSLAAWIPSNHRASQLGEVYPVFSRIGGERKAREKVKELRHCSYRSTSQAIGRNALTGSPLAEPTRGLEPGRVGGERRKGGQKLDFDPLTARSIMSCDSS
jgi:hypothetical protein